MILLAIIGINISLIQWLPFGLDIALAIQPLFFIGTKIRKYNIIPNKIAIVMSCFIWLLLASIIFVYSHTYLNIANRVYPLFPICYLCALSGTIFVSNICYIIGKLKYISKPLKFMGKHTLIMLMVHTLDIYVIPVKYTSSNNLINISVRIIFDIAVSLIILFLINQLKKFIFKKNIKQ